MLRTADVRSKRLFFAAPFDVGVYAFVTLFQSLVIEGKSSAVVYGNASSELIAKPEISQSVLVAKVRALFVPLISGGKILCGSVSGLIADTDAALSRSVTLLGSLFVPLESLVHVLYYVATR